MFTLSFIKWNRNFSTESTKRVQWALEHLHELFRCYVAKTNPPKHTVYFQPLHICTHKAQSRILFFSPVGPHRCHLPRFNTIFYINLFLTILSTEPHISVQAIKSQVGKSSSIMKTQGWHPGFLFGCTEGHIPCTWAFTKLPVKSHSTISKLEGTKVVAVHSRNSKWVSYYLFIHSSFNIYYVS